ncbi:hypothetical protein H2200_007842 [Cladophialophora chaetospira]|uniref:Isomerase n=1 Tax=Cladophialophora chaetospira TaxID=386627 RepID=A0AA38X6L2_9EURO|nr:hypothetical protein H2200_007842 [Cladophialophora chaetospira]
MTEGAFKGNPTPVFILDDYHQDADFQKWPADAILQTVAREMNQSETIFVKVDEDDDGGDGDHNGYLIRSFTPYKEEPFCGHGMVAAAHLLARSMGHSLGRAMRFKTVGGIVVDARLEGYDAKRGFEYGEARIFRLEIPARPVNQWYNEDIELRKRIADTLVVDVTQILALGRNELMDLAIELSHEVDFSAGSMQIDAVALMNASPPGTRSQIITSRGDRYGVDFVKRVFAYGSEDQGTGSTYCVLIPYWHSRLEKLAMSVKQVSDRTAMASVASNAKKEGYVTLYGSAVKVMDGRMLVPNSTA